MTFFGCSHPFQMMTHPKLLSSICFLSIQFGQDTFGIYICCYYFVTTVFITVGFGTALTNANPIREIFP